MSTRTPPVLCPLRSLRFVEATGGDAKSFLNAQLSNSVADRADRAALAAWHDPSGRVLALMHVLRCDEPWLLMTHGADPADLCRRLSAFILRDDVQLRDASARWRGAVAVGEVDRWLADRDAVLGPEPGDTAITGDVRLVRTSPATAYVVATAAAYEAIEPRFARAEGDEADLAEIGLGLPNVPPQLAGRFSPQMLNLDHLGALSFSKGCYPGQEVIARIRNLGSVKRRLFRFSAASGEPPPVGATLIDPAGAEVGEVVRAARAGADRVEFLAVVQTEAARARLALGIAPVTPLTRESLPGPGDTPPQ